MFCSLGFTFMMTVIFKHDVLKHQYICDIPCGEDQYWSGFCGENPCHEDDYNEAYDNVMSSGYSEEQCGAIICPEKMKRGLARKFYGSASAEDGDYLDCGDHRASMDELSDDLCDKMECYFYTPDDVDRACEKANIWVTLMILGICAFIYDQCLKTCAECGCVQNKNKVRGGGQGAARNSRVELVS
jgi:hypothetical protein